MLGTYRRSRSFGRTPGLPHHLPLVRDLVLPPGAGRCSSLSAVPWLTFTSNWKPLQGSQLWLRQTPFAGSAPAAPVESLQTLPEWRLRRGSGAPPGSRSPRRDCWWPLTSQRALGARRAQHKTLCFPTASPGKLWGFFPPFSRRQRCRGGRALCCARPGRRPLAARGKAAAAPCRVPERQPGRSSGWDVGSDAEAASAGSRLQRAARRRLRGRQGLYPLAEGYRCLTRRHPTEAVLKRLRQHFVKERLIGWRDSAMVSW